MVVELVRAPTLWQSVLYRSFSVIASGKEHPNESESLWLPRGSCGDFCCSRLLYWRRCAAWGIPWARCRPCISGIPSRIWEAWPVWFMDSSAGRSSARPSAGCITDSPGRPASRKGNQPETPPKVGAVSVPHHPPAYTELQRSSLHRAELLPEDHPRMTCESAAIKRQDAARTE